MKVPFYLHNLEESDIERIDNVLRSPFLTTGKVTGEFETKFAAYLEIDHVVGLTSCTMALFLALKTLGVGPGDEAITTPISFVATANTIMHAGAVPVFVDVEKETGNIDASKIEAAITERTKAIVPVHLYGQMADMKAIQAIAKKYGLLVVEDAAHAVESSRDGYRSGHLGDAAAFSFYATKNLTCGEGGALATTDADLAENLKKMRLHGMTKNAADRYHAKRYEHYDVEMLGYKCNMDNLHAALLVEQLDRLDSLNSRRQAICERYESVLGDINAVDFPKVLPGSKSARHLFTIWVDPQRRDDILWKLQEREIGVAVNFRAIHLMKLYRERFGYAEGSYPNAESISQRTITLPLYPKMSDEQVDYVLQALREIVTA